MTLRNSIHTALSEKFGEFWFDKTEMIKTPKQVEHLSDAKVSLLRKKLCTITDGRIVAELPFGFWTAMVGDKYENFWQQHLYKISKGKRRKDFSGPLNDIRKLRNRVAHHEPIFHMNLQANYENLFRIVGYLSPEAQFWLKENCSFSDTFKTVKDVFDNVEK